MFDIGNWLSESWESLSSEWNWSSKCREKEFSIRNDRIKGKYESCVFELKEAKKKLKLAWIICVVLVYNMFKIFM